MQVVAEGLKNPSAKVPESNRDKSLGDRSTYIGASSATGCLRKAYIDVMEITDIDHQQVFVFERGHQLEDMIRKGLNGAGYTEFDCIEDAKGLNIVHQLEVRGLGESNFLLAHIDFISINRRKRELVVLEIKSSKVIPDGPYDSHILQNQLQMRLVEQNYPDYSVRGKIVYFNWDNGTHQEFDTVPVVETQERAILQGQKLWNAINAKEEPEPEEQMYCGKCPHKMTCPLMDFGACLPKDYEQYVQRIVTHSKADSEMKAIKAEIIETLQSMNVSGAKVGTFNVKLAKVAGKKGVDADLLRRKYPDVYKEVITISKGYSFLKVI
ncbi:Dna2/Cas4 domain-containing protein [Aquamicrobium sp.]|uniref:Dna2/Cas4 domain-containing protein n=1 Tax=Aquamicrobium sp. TaxID=1872579 RepID=UPI00258C9636|nr:Dna2/Cas4 domain-containing protein [Aquamicrobium sp.]MCK9553270.1 Dna2/Cas4 domain-containing protein [Aquamicrobium sp.]